MKRFGMKGMRSLRYLTGLALLSSSCVSWAALPLPRFTGANPQMVYPGAPGFTDGNGRVAVYLQGEHLAPRDGVAAGWNGGYQHIFVRSVSASSVAGAWVRCVDENGCMSYGGGFTNVVVLGFDPARFLGQRGSHAQVRMWVSMSPTLNESPEGSVSESDWSNIWTIDAAAPGAVPSTSAPPPARPPAITKVAPAEILIRPDTNYRIRIYGDICGGDRRVVLFDGDGASPVTPEENNCRGYDDDGTLLPGKTALVHVTIPERLRKPGTLTVAVQHSGGRSNPLPIKIQSPVVKPGGFAPRVDVPVSDPVAVSPNALRSPVIAKPPAASDAPARPGFKPAPVMPSPGVVPVIPPIVRTDEAAAGRRVAPPSAPLGDAKPLAQTPRAEMAAPPPVNLRNPLTESAVTVPSAAVTRSPANGGAIYIAPAGEKVTGEVRGNQLFLLDDGAWKLAPDGTYRKQEGNAIIVQNGLIVQGGLAPRMGVTVPLIRR